jgi:hypothetical protein
LGEQRFRLRQPGCDGRYPFRFGALSNLQAVFDVPIWFQNVLRDLPPTPAKMLDVVSVVVHIGWEGSK